MKKLSIFLFSIILLVSCNRPEGLNPRASGYIHIDDAKIYYEVFGQGEPILLIHAGITDSRMWDFQVRDLAKEFMVVRFDQRGFGKSTLPASSYNAVRDIITLMDSLQLSAAHVAGICLGALQATDMAIEYPDRVKSLIISGTGIPGWPEQEEVIEKYIEFTNYVNENGPDSAVKKMITDPFWNHSLPNSMYPEARELFEHILYENRQSFMVNWQLRELPMGLPERLGEIECPVLLFRPEFEIPNLVPIADTIAAKVPQIEIHEMKGVYHLLNMEKPEEFNSKIKDFIRSL